MSNTQLERREIMLELPKFKLEPPSMDLGMALKALGLKTAFDPAKAHFDKMTERKGLLSISHVFHKTFIDLNENGTEAAAATAVVMTLRALAHNPPQPMEVHVDHPFLYAIQDRKSGACLFIGQAVDPR
ncbi:MAG: serpin family protein [Chthoniobacteraceae bacterium]